MGVTVRPDGPARVDHARVDNVDMVNMTLDVTTTFTHRELTVPYLVPYTHGDHAGGINFMPEVGSHCYVCIPSDETAFVLGFVQNPRNIPKEVRDENNEIVEAVTDSGPDFSGLRHPLEPGDIMLSATDDNFIVLRRGGVLQIGSTPLAQRVYIPIENTVRDFFQRYQAYSPLGEIEWGHAALSSDDDMASARNTPVLVKYNIKAKAQEDVTEGKFTIEVRAGNLDNSVLDTDSDAEHLFANESLRQVGLPISPSPSIVPRAPVSFSGIPEDGVGALSITVYSHDDDQKRVTYAFQVDKSGNNFLRVEGSIHAEVANTVYAKADKGVKIDFGDGGVAPMPTGSSIEMLQSNEFKAYVRTMVLEAVQDLTLTSPNITIGPGNLTIAANVVGGVAFGAGGSLGEGASVVVDKDLLQKLMTHTHPLVDPINPGQTLPSPSLASLGQNKADLKAK